MKKSDVSTRHYDRYDYLTERRAAMKEWNAFMRQILAGEFDVSASRQRIQNAIPQSLPTDRSFAHRIGG
jgi:hypothetical protein